jgi:phosphatidate cytidylyltransferase
VEGAIGGLLGSAAACLIATAAFRAFGVETPSYAVALALAVIGGAAGQVGDLAASLVKRHCGIKDFGSIFPGHGGIMDRLDSVMFALIVVCSYCIVLV